MLYNLKCYSEKVLPHTVGGGVRRWPQEKMPPLLTPVLTDCQPQPAPSSAASLRPHFTALSWGLGHTSLQGGVGWARRGWEQGGNLLHVTHSAGGPFSSSGRSRPPLSWAASIHHHHLLLSRDAGSMPPAAPASNSRAIPAAYSAGLQRWPQPDLCFQSCPD